MRIAFLYRVKKANHIINNKNSEFGIKMPGRQIKKITHNNMLGVGGFRQGNKK